MDTVLGDAKFNCAMAYMDDVVVFSKTLDDHINHLQVVLQRMNDAGLTINPKKVQLASSRVALLGFVVEHGFLHPQEEKLKAMIEFPTPQDKKSLQRYLGMVGFYRQFISNCADLARPLHELLRRDVPWNWTAAHEEAFRTLAVAIADTASLRLPDLNATFVLQTDASEYGLGVVLLQEHNGALRPVAFASHTLSAAERNYTVTEKECLAIIFALKKFDMYLDGATFTIQTDHQALTWLKNLKNPAGRLARWALTLQGYNFSIEYRPGKSNIAADALSRAPLPPQEKEEATELVAVTNEELSWGVVVTREQLLRAQRADDLCQQISTRLNQPSSRGQHMTDAPTDTYVQSNDGLLLRYIPQADEGDPTTSPFRVVVPKILRRTFISYFHDSVLAGHSDGKKTYQKLCRIATWPRMNRDVLRYARSCPQCQTAKPRGGKPLGFMQSVQSHRPWEIVACDIMGPFPRSPQGHRYLLVVTDHFSKWVDLHPLRQLTSKKIWDKLRETFSRFGYPVVLLTDQATYYTSTVFENCCEILGIQHNCTSPYHPQANITERVNRNLRAMLILYTNEHRDWDSYIPEMAFATHTTENRTTGFTPARLNFGRELRVPMENTIELAPDARPRQSHSRFAQRLRDNIRNTVTMARGNIELAQSRQRTQYNRGRRNVEFSVGDLVLRRTHPLSNASQGFSASLAKRWEGPFVVETRITRLAYRLRCPITGARVGPVNINDLKPFIERGEEC